MIFIYIDKNTKHVASFSSIKAMCNSTLLKPDRLYYHFTRKGRSEIETDEYRIVKRELVKSKRRAKN